MKHVLTLLLLIVSGHALATATLPTNENLMALLKENVKENPKNNAEKSVEESAKEIVTVTQTEIKTQPSVNITVQQGYFNYETLAPILWQSDDQQLQFSEMSIVSNTELSTAKNSFEQFIGEHSSRFEGMNIRYNKDNLTLSLALLNNQSLTMPQEKIFIQGSLTVWTLDNFNLSIQGRLSASRSWGASNNIYPQSRAQNGETQINKSLSVVGSYLLSESWAVTGAVMKADLDEAFKRRVSNDKDSDNVALIGTIYSF